MKLKSKLLISFFLVAGILVFAGAMNIFFFLRINRSIDELVENRFVIEQNVQDGHLIINKIYNKIWDAMLSDMSERTQQIAQMDELAISFYRIMDSISDDPSYPEGNIRDHKRYFQTYYIVGKDILSLPGLTSFQRSEEKIDRFKFYKIRLTDQIDKRFEKYKDQFAKSLSELQKNTYLIAAFSTVSVLFGALMALLLSFKLSSSLVRPILDLTSTIRKFTTGTKQVKAYESSGNEIGRLGMAFNEMTRQLNKSIEDLEAQIIETKQAEKKAFRRREQLIQADKMVSLGILVSGVAHEINNPNQFIMSHIEPLKNAWEGAIPVLDRYREEYGDFRVGGTNYSLIKKKIPQIFSNVLKGSRRIKIIVDELKNFVIEQPRDLNARVNINEIVDSALSLIFNMIKNATRDFSFVKGKNIPLIPGHYQRLEQVVVNLLQNACQALDSPDDAICIQTHYNEANHDVMIQVHDNGKGIPNENLGHLTDPFFTTKRDQGGTGLGLSISARIIADHHGTIAFESREGKGTTATVKLPVILGKKI